MRDVVVVGAGLAGLSAAWRLRHWDTVVLESDDRVGGRIRSERRGSYWLNWGGHVFAGPGSSTEALLDEAGVMAVDIPGSLQALSMNGKFIRNGHIATYPFRIPMPLSARAATIRAGMKVVAGVGKYTGVVRKRNGESGAMRQQRITENLAAALGDRVELGATVEEVVHRKNSVVVRYRQGGRDHEVQARTVVLATTADVSHRVGVDLPPNLRGALSQIQYGPHVSSAFLTDEQTPQPWDDIYAIAAPKRSEVPPG